MTNVADPTTHRRLLAAVAIPVLALALTAGCARRSGGEATSSGAGRSAPVTTPTATRPAAPPTTAHGPGTTASTGGDDVDPVDAELQDLEQQLRGVDDDTKQAGDAMGTEEGDPTR